MASDIFQTGYTNVKNAAGQGNSAISSFDPTNEANKTQSGYDDLFNKQQNTQKNYIQSYKDSIMANPKATDLYNTGNQMFNVPTLQNNATTLNNAVLTTPQQNVDMAKGFNYDQNQVNHQTSQDLARLSPLAIAAQNSANTASSLAKGYVDNGMAQNATNLLPVQAEGQMTSDLFARQAAGYTTAAEQRFNGLSDKMKAGIQLSTAEMAEYAQLAQAEQNYQASLNNNATTLKNTQLGNQYQTVGAGSTLLNTANGSVYRGR